MVKKTYLTILIICIFLGSISQNSEKASFEPLAKLILKTNSGYAYEYSSIVQQYLKQIGLDVSIIVEDTFNFDSYLKDSTCFDLAVIQYPDRVVEHDLYKYYLEGAQYNIFGITNDMPYCMENELILKEFQETTNFADGCCVIYPWHDLVMDYILPAFPLFCHRLYAATWSTLMGFNMRWGISDCLPYMEWSNYHKGQESLTEFIDSADHWNEELSVFPDNDFSFYSLIMEDLLKLSPDYHALKTGVIDDWEQINESYFSFHMREGSYWNPSYNTTERNEESLDLSSAPVMLGLKGKYSNGENQEITARDAVFTLLLLGNEITNNNAEQYEWLKDIWVDSEDELTFHIVMDGNPVTAELEPYNLIWKSLNYALLPEFFLNSTQETITSTISGIEMKGIYQNISNSPEWESYTISPFGCGKYMLDYYIQNSLTVLQKSSYWFEVGAIDGTAQDLDIERVVIRKVESYKLALEEFKEGKLDRLILEENSYDRKMFQFDARFCVQTRIHGPMYLLVFNLNSPFLGGEKNYLWSSREGRENYTVGTSLRKAVCYSINREEINVKLHDGELLISDHLYYTTCPQWYGCYFKYRYDLEKALDWLHVEDGPNPYLSTTQTVNITIIDTVTYTETILVTVTVPFISPMLTFAVIIVMISLRKLTIKRENN